VNPGVPSLTAIRYLCERYVKKSLFAYTIHRVPMIAIRSRQRLVTNGINGPISDLSPVQGGIRFPQFYQNQLVVRVLGWKIMIHQSGR
jgi:hypothetical protein